MNTLDIGDLSATRTITALLREQAAVRPDALHAIFPDARFTFGELHARAMAYARAYIAMGVRPGDHVATLMPNCASWLPAYYGGLYAGAVVVALNARYKRQELAFTLAHSNARLLVTTGAFAEHVDFEAILRSVLPELNDTEDASALKAASAPDLRAVILCDAAPVDGFLSEDAFLALGDGIDDEMVTAAGDARALGDTAAIIYTSGTTSKPKGCELTHASIQNSWSTFSGVVSLAAGETVWTPMPFFHTGGIGPITTILSRGAAFVTQPHYQPDGVVKMVAEHRVNHLYPGFPQLAFSVIEHPEFDRERFTFVRSLLNVGPPAMQKRIQDLLPSGAVLVNLFGMTEGSGIVTFTPVDAPYHVRAQTSGMPPPHTEVRIADPETNAPCPPGQPGEIQFRGGGAFKCYYADPEATAATILPEGWVRSGDQGRINEEGYLVYLGRLKDMLKVGGENVAAAEIEAFIQQLPEVRLVQVIGVADDRLGEVPVAFVELVEGRTISEAEVIACCDGQLAKWKVPRAVIFVDEWPMSTTKVQKFRLAERLPPRFRDSGSRTS